MKPLTLMFIAGETSGDLLAAELVHALRDELALAAARPTHDVQPLRASLAPRFFGAGGPRLAAAGVELAIDLTAHSAVGIGDVLKKLGFFVRVKNRLLALASERQPDAIICVDFSGFNCRFARAVKAHVRAHYGWFQPWNPKLIQYVSPQVWASRPARAQKMARVFDLLLAIFPFEKEWYAQRVPGFRVEFVGHPIFDRYGAQADANGGANPAPDPARPLVALLPGSRLHELKRHIPVMRDAWLRLRAAQPGLRGRMVLPGEDLLALARKFNLPDDISLQSGGLAEVLCAATLAIASTGTVTIECAYFRVPTVTLYKTSAGTYQIAKRLIRVNSITMPNLLAKETLFPEFLQNEATAENIARAALELLNDPARCARIQARLTEVIASLGGPGASRRAARCIAELLIAPTV